METLEVVYYTCVNRDCPKYRNVFTEGDPQHESCARERLFLEGERAAAPLWLLIMAPVALAAMAAGAVLLLRMMRANKPEPRTLHEELPMKTWSGANAHRDDREGNPVPPPIT